MTEHPAVGPENRAGRDLAVDADVPVLNTAVKAGSTPLPLTDVEVRPLIFMGAANSFREIVPIIRDINAIRPTYQVVGVVDDDPRFHGMEIEGIPVIGALEEASKYPSAKLVFGIASHKTRLVREHILGRLSLPLDRFETIIHPSARIYSSAVISPGAIVYPGAIVCNNAVVGSFSVLTFDVIIGPHARIDRCAMFGSRSVVLASAVIGPSAFIGANSVIGERIQIGAAAAVVMGSVVFQNVRPGAIVQGNPARRIMQGKIPPELANVPPES